MALWPVEAGLAYAVLVLVISLPSSGYWFYQADFRRRVAETLLPRVEGRMSRPTQPTRGEADRVLSMLLEDDDTVPHGNERFKAVVMSCLPKGVLDSAEQNIDKLVAERDELQQRAVTRVVAAANERDLDEFVKRADTLVRREIGILGRNGYVKVARLLWQYWRGPLKDASTWLAVVLVVGGVALAAFHRFLPASLPAAYSIHVTVFGGIAILATPLRHTFTNLQEHWTLAPRTARLLRLAAVGVLLGAVALQFTDNIVRFQTRMFVADEATPDVRAFYGLLAIVVLAALATWIYRTRIWRPAGRSASEYLRALGAAAWLVYLGAIFLVVAGAICVSGVAPAEYAESPLSTIPILDTWMVAGFLAALSVSAVSWSAGAIADRR